MGIFSGPSKYVTHRMAQGVASSALQLKFLRDLPASDQRPILDGMQAEGVPTSMDELISAAASVIIQHNMGAWRKGQYLEMIRAAMVSGGYSASDAKYLTGMIELDKGKPRPQGVGRETKSPSAASQLVTPEPKAPDVKPVISEPARPINQRYGFRAGDFIVYPAHGVGQIVAIEQQEIAGAELELFVINFANDDMTLRVPTAKFLNVGLRKLSEPAKIRQAQGALSSPGIDVIAPWSHRTQEYEAKINSGDIVVIAEVVRDLYRSPLEAEQSYSERQLYEAALDRLSREISIVHQITKTEAASEVEGILIARPRGPQTTKDESSTQY